ncbi:hypothetical protein N658DRAFT_331456 [Parathielavia hyrcaniae]|uniref:Uncharacterized protein n=1 Tax=Parathielavia hyrcaniae TaxID=113614 RepID=A0AAN6T3R5_9PEZI|nr:hypothetical protein N658DRAFT_331456 [Parathielavia hyrcaniae]
MLRGTPGLLELTSCSSCVRDSRFQHSCPTRRFPGRLERRALMPDMEKGSPWQGPVKLDLPAGSATCAPNWVRKPGQRTRPSLLVAVVSTDRPRDIMLPRVQGGWSPIWRLSKQQGVLLGVASSPPHCRSPETRVEFEAKIKETPTNRYRPPSQFGLCVTGQLERRRESRSIMAGLAAITHQ